MPGEDPVPPDAPPTLEYRPPQAEPPTSRVNVPAALVAGVVAGAASMGAIVVSQSLVALFAAPLAGAIAAGVAASMSRRAEFRAGLLSSAAATATVMLWVAWQGRSFSWDHLLFLLLFYATFVAAGFGIPGLLVSFLVWADNSSHRERIDAAERRGTL